MTTAAIYARVSARDQNVNNQLAELRRFAAGAGYHLVGEYIDQESGASPDRAAFRRMMSHAHQRRFDVLLFWSLDRFTREGAARTLEYLTRLDSYGVRFRSYTEQYLDSCGIFREAVISILAVIAKQERVRISERTKAGLDRARAQGRKPGRPRRLVDLVKARERLGQGWTLEKIAVECGVSPATVSRRLQANRTTIAAPASASAAAST